MKFLFWGMVSFWLCHSNTHAQTKPSPSLKALKQMMAKYNQPGFLSFDMMSRFAEEAAPGNYLDSLDGAVKLNGNRYWFRMQNTESVNTGTYIITIFGEEKLMHLSPVKSAGPAQPVGLPFNNDILFRRLDSLSATGEISIELKEEIDIQQVIISFPPNHIYKQMRYEIDARTGWLRKSVCVVRMQAMMGIEAQQEAAGNGYAVVESLFSNYTMEKFDQQLLMQDRYIRAEGDSFATSQLYKEYKLFNEATRSLPVKQ